jgi:hypothetical protein
MEAVGLNIGYLLGVFVVLSIILVGLVIVFMRRNNSKKADDE